MPPHSRTSHPALQGPEKMSPPPCVPHPAQPRVLFGNRQQEQRPNPASWCRDNTEGRQGTGHHRRGRLALVWDVWGWPGQHSSQPLWGPSPPAHLASRMLPSPAPGTGPHGLRPHKVPSSCLWVGKEQRPPRERTFRAADTLPGCAAAQFPQQLDERGGALASPHSPGTHRTGPSYSPHTAGLRSCSELELISRAPLGHSLRPQEVRDAGQRP